MTNVEELTREDAIYYARLSEQGERYQDMIMYMKKVAKVSVLLANGLYQSSSEILSN